MTPGSISVTTGSGMGPEYREMAATAVPGTGAPGARHLRRLVVVPGLPLHPVRVPVRRALERVADGVVGRLLLEVRVPRARPPRDAVGPRIVVVLLRPAVGQAVLDDRDDP